MVLVTTTASKHALLIREMAGPEKIPCVNIAYTLVEPASNNLEIKQIIKVVYQGLTT
jgi:hypothetical protein